MKEPDWYGRVCPFCYWRKSRGSWCGCEGEKVARRARGFWARIKHIMTRHSAGSDD